MCDMQKMPTREDASCEDGSEMNFTAFSAVGGAGTHFVTTGGQLPVAKLQQNVSNNGTSLSQVVSMVGGVSLPEGMQYVRTLDGGAALQNTPQLISVPIALPGVKPGDPQPTVQIQVLNPNLTLQTQQQPKYQMQIPIQGFQQGGAVLTVAYSPETNENGTIQLLGNSLPEGTMRMRSGLQVLAALPQDMQLMQSAQGKDQMGQNVQHQVFVTQDHQIVITNPGENKPLNNNTSGDNNNTVEIVIKEECDETMNDDESSQGTETSEGVSWQLPNNSQDLVKYMNTLPLQEKQVLPVSLQQFLKLNPNQEIKKDCTEMEVNAATELRERTVAEAMLDEDGVIIIKKKKKYKKKTKPARPKPGQVVITTTSDGTLIYCCPECQMAYPAKEQLEMHLVVHKIERRFICGLCGAGLKRKEHLERHKLGHNPERPYVCGVCRKGFKRREHLNLHTVIHSGVKTEMCGECGKGFYRKDHLRKHARSHETKRARDGNNGEQVNVKREVGSPPAAAAPSTAAPDNNVLPEITIHVPTSANMQMPIQINIPQHMVSSLAAAQAQSAQQALNDAHCQLDALLAEHS